MSASRLVRLSLLVTLFLGATSGLQAQENMELGKMWTFEHPPLEYLEATYGFAPDQPWLDKTRLASVRLDSGCSASFVSERGLILTNHHCVRDFVKQVSPPGEDWLNNGMVARSLKEEVKLPGLTLSQLHEVKDVTEAINKGITDDDDDNTIARKRDANREAVLAEAKKQNPDFTPEVVSLYQGGMFKLYSYRKWEDVRLCMAPHLQTAHFGGDPDNFTYPRFGIDFALIRAYENDVPADTSKFHFGFNENGAEEGDLVFVTGNPGTTKRLNTLAEMELARDIELPIQLEEIDKLLEVRRGIVKRDPSQKERQQTMILRLENGQKAYRGYLGGVRDDGLMAHKAKAEAQFKAKVMGDPALRSRFGDAWQRIDEICKEMRDLLPRDKFMNPSFSQALGRAVALVNAFDEVLPDDERKKARNQASRGLRPVSGGQKAWQASRLELAQKWLPEDDPFARALRGNGADHDIVAVLSTKSRMADDDFVKDLLEKGAQAVAASDDPAIEIARNLVPRMRTNAKRLKTLREQRSVHSVRLGQALFAVYGTKVAPDATFTLRISDGVVAGFPYNGTIAPAWTSFYGLYARNVEFGNEYPFNLPQIWLDRKDKIDMRRPVNFVSTNDIIGGNSGSPVINRKQEVVGLVFDGNIEMLPNRYVYKDDIPRSVSVHTAAIMEALRRIYDADPLANELLGKGGYK